MSAACAPTVCSTPARLCPGPFSWVDYNSPSISIHSFTLIERSALLEIAENPKSLGLPIVDCGSLDVPDVLMTRLPHCCSVIRCRTGRGSMDLDGMARKMSPYAFLIYVTSCPAPALKGHWDPNL